MKRKKIFKIILITFIILAIIIGSGMLYVIIFLPNIPAPDLKVKVTGERVERGKYLAYHVCVCMDCHSTRDWTRFSGPMVEGTDGKGGEIFDKKLGFPGTFTSTNITPANLSSYSDGEIYRAIVNGVGKGRRPLLTIMPYLDYGKMATEDIYSIIAFLRTLSPITTSPVTSKADFPVNILLHTFPKKASPQAIPIKSDTVAYGKYIVNAAGCIGCHTPMEKGSIVIEKAFNGGAEFKFPFGTIRSSNLTPDPQTGIGKMKRDEFIQRFKTYDPKTYSPQPVSEKDYNSIMPWMMYAGMDTVDLAAIYAFLKCLKPVNNPVVKYTPAGN